MRLANLLDRTAPSMDPLRQQAMAKAYTPIIRTILIPGSAYYLYITFSHWRDETGLSLAILGSLSALTAFCFYMLRQIVLTKQSTSLLRLELSGLLINLLLYVNVLVYLLINFEQSKLVYFAMMAVVFSTTGVTLRATLASVFLSLTTLYWFASGLSGELFSQYVAIGVATAFGSLAMATLLRKAIFQQIDARLLADRLATKARRLADTDMLTGVPNRRAIFEKIDYLVQQRRPFWLGIFDLDGFKAINDVYGHIVGDNLLCAVVNRASALNIEGATFGRIGGDEFVAIFTGNVDAETAKHLGATVIDSISSPYPLDLLELSIGASAGFSHFPSMGASGAQLYEKADYALLKAKTQTRGKCVLFNTAEDAEMKRAIEIERALREGDLEQELFLLFQPQYSPEQGRVVGFEALAR